MALDAKEIVVGGVYEGSPKSAPRKVKGVACWWSTKPHYEVEYIGSSGRVISVNLSVFAKWATRRINEGGQQ